MRGVSITIVFALVVTACGGSAGDDSAPTATTGADVTVTSEVVSTTAAPIAGPATSADGRLSAVSSDGTALTISEADPDALGFGEYEVYGAYDLGPSGTTFGAPVEVSFDTGIEWDHTELPFVFALLGTEDGNWEVVGRVSISDNPQGTAQVDVQVDHFSPIVFVGSDYAIDIDPYEVYGWPGYRWDAGWDIVDRKLERVVNRPARRGIAFDPDSDRIAATRVRELVDGVTIHVESWAGGAVSVVPGMDEVGTYRRFPLAGYRFGSGNDFVETFYGYDTFECVEVGSGAYGFEVDIDVDRADLLVAGRLSSGRVVLVRPRDGVRFLYDVHGHAECEELDYRPLIRFLQGYMGLSTEQVKAIAALKYVDGMSDGIFSISTILPGLFPPYVDLWDLITFVSQADEVGLGYLYNNSVFECGESHFSEDAGVEVTTVCAADVTMIPAGEVVVVAAVYSGPLPSAGSPDHYTYAAVFESNDDPSDDWQFRGDFDWDFFIGTDRWYQANWDPNSQSWSMTVTNGLDPGGPSGARAIVMGDTIIWVIPRDEFAAEVPEVRVTSFIHDGTYRPEVSGGDVNGADPTEQLVPVLPLG